MNIKKLTLAQGDIPARLTRISSPPKQLYVLGDRFTELLDKPCLAVVGSRKVSPYGRSVTTKLAEDAARQGIIIISGLALGIDGLAHQAALNAGTPTIAVLPCGLDRIYPSTHHQLAKQIVEQGGALITEYPPETEPYKTNFVARNRLIAALGDGVLITEAAEKSGSLHTANFALEQGREVMAVPGNITSDTSKGTNNLIKSGAVPVTSIEDILQALKVEQKGRQDAKIIAANAEEYTLLELLRGGITDSAALLQSSELTPAAFNQTLTMLEITGKIKNLGANHWTLA